jgi:hypothetical protein
MVEADSHLKLLPTSKLDVYKVFEHIDMLSMGIQYQPYKVLLTILDSDFGESCALMTVMIPLLQGQQRQLNDYTSLTMAETLLQ